jgi:hypothetical protein
MYRVPHSIVKDGQGNGSNNANLGRTWIQIVNLGLAGTRIGQFRMDRDPDLTTYNFQGSGTDSLKCTYVDPDLTI